MGFAGWRKSTVCRTIGLCLILLLWTAADAHAQHRVALVIGNSDYQNAPPLPSPARDAAAMAKLFKDAGFDTVVMQTNLGNVDFKRAILKFEEAAIDSDVAVVFYAGHGIEIGGTNYLIPVDAKLAADDDVLDQAILLDRLVAPVTDAKRLGLVILDASRNNPFVNTMKHTTASRPAVQGLTNVEPAGSHTLIAYAAKAGSNAEEGAGEHSPFTTALLANLTAPGLDIRLAFGRIRDQVLKMTDNRQEPFVYGTLGGGLVTIVPASGSPDSLQPSSAYDAARRDYDFVAKIGTRKAWGVFLETYPTGFFAELARAHLAGLPPEQSASCLMDCIGDWLHSNKCDALGNVCIEMAEKRCQAVVANSANRCGPDADHK
jgi:hypothetical protein